MYTETVTVLIHDTIGSVSGFVFHSLDLETQTHLAEIDRIFVLAWRWVG